MPPTTFHQRLIRYGIYRYSTISTKLSISNIKADIKPNLNQNALQLTRANRRSARQKTLNILRAFLAATAIVSCGHAWARRAQSYFGRGHAVPTLPPCQSASVGTHMPVRRPIERF